MKKLIALLAALALMCSMALAETPVKDETVYIIAAPDGSARRIIVSDHLTNPQGADEMEDRSNLSEIENVKGEEEFDGEKWQAAGRDIYYRGESEEKLPVEMKITYTLDGEEISPEDAAGKSGHMCIRFEYDAAKTVQVTIDGRTQETNVPYLVITAALLENEVFSNVQAVNARLIDDGERTIVLGAVLPGFRKDCSWTAKR